MRPEMFEIQVKIEVQKKCGCGTEKVWTSICPTGSSIPYRFTTRAEAEKMAAMCYGSTVAEYRIV
jgi:hypothetical protein